jgi:micrococcal nuclease
VYTYEVKVIRIVDGDTLECDVDLGFGVWKRGETFRLYGPDSSGKMGMDAPEKRTAAGQRAITFLTDWLEKTAHWNVTIVTVKDRKEKYGRYMAVVWCGSVNLNQLMLDAGHATLKRY